MWLFHYFYIFYIQKIFTFFVSLYKGFYHLFGKLFVACFIVLDNLWKVFKCSIIPNFMSTMFEFSMLFGCWAIIFDRFTNFLIFSLQIRLMVFFGITRISFFLINLIVNDSKSWIITVLFRKSNLFILVFMKKVYKFFDCHLFYSTKNI